MDVVSLSPISSLVLSGSERPTLKVSIILVLRMKKDKLTKSLLVLFGVLRFYSVPFNEGNLLFSVLHELRLIPLVNIQLI